MRKQIYKKKTVAVPKSADCLYETIYWMRLRLEIDNPVKKVELNRDLFSDFDNDLYFYYADLQRTSMKKEEKEKVYSILDSLEQEFRQQGIHFVYTVAADKYDVYQPFVKDNVYPSCTLLDSLPDGSGSLLSYKYGGNSPSSCAAGDERCVYSDGQSLVVYRFRSCGLGNCDPIS